MQDNVSVLIATILAVVIIVIFPIYNVATRNDSISNNMVIKATTNFVDSVRNKGYIESEEYGEYLNELSKTGNIYDVEMEIYKPMLIETSDGSHEYEEKYEIVYTDEIENELYNADRRKENTVVNKNVYYLDADCKFYVRVKNTNITQAQILMDRLLGAELKNRIVVNYGGIVYSNEWAIGKSPAKTVANVTISRPMNYLGEEFKYEEITQIFDPITGNTSYYYGIKVKLDDYEKVNRVIKFKVTYTDVKFFEGTDDEYNSREDDIARKKRENHVENHIKLDDREGYPVKGNKYEVKELSVDSGNDGMYNYEYEVTVSEISYYYLLPYAKSRLTISAGSAYSIAGKLTEANSKEFVVIYNQNLIMTVEKRFFGMVGGVSKVYLDITLNEDHENIEALRIEKGEHSILEFRDDSSFGTDIKNHYDETAKKYIWEAFENSKYTIYAKEKGTGIEVIKVVDVSENIVVDIQKRFEDKDTIVDPDVDSYDKVFLDISLNQPNSNVESIKWAYGEYTADNFKNDNSLGTNIKSTYNSTTDKYSFRALKNGTYSIYVKLNDTGIESVKTIEVTENTTYEFKIVYDTKKLEAFCADHWDWVEYQHYSICYSGPFAFGAYIDYHPPGWLYRRVAINCDIDVEDGLGHIIEFPSSYRWREYYGYKNKWGTMNYEFGKIVAYLPSDNDYWDYTDCWYEDGEKMAIFKNLNKDYGPYYIGIFKNPEIENVADYRNHYGNKQFSGLKPPIKVYTRLDGEEIKIFDTTSGYTFNDGDRLNVIKYNKDGTYSIENNYINT